MQQKILQLWHFEDTRLWADVQHNGGNPSGIFQRIHWHRHLLLSYQSWKKGIKYCIFISETIPLVRFFPLFDISFLYERQIGVTTRNIRGKLTVQKWRIEDPSVTVWVLILAKILALSSAHIFACVYINHTTSGVTQPGGSKWKWCFRTHRLLGDFNDRLWSITNLKNKDKYVRISFVISLKDLNIIKLHF